jgi:RNA polymerase-binding transcription factor DksA
LVILFIVITCSSVVSFLGKVGQESRPFEVIESARQRGAQAGREEGRRAGEAEGFTGAFHTAENEAYRKTINELYQSREYRRIPLFTIAVVIGFFIVGFLLQWIVFYVPRRIGFLRDIDWIVLPKEMNRVDWDDIVPRRLTGTMLILFLTTLPLIGCKNPEQEAWQQGYDANRQAAYQEGRQEGVPRGEKEGEEQGRTAAQRAARTGRAWQLYSTPTILALMFGAIVGIAVQYTTLACCKDAGRLPELVTMAFVPAMKHSLAYAVLASRRKLLLWREEEMRRQAAANDLRRAHMHAVHDFVVRKLKAMTALEELTQARILDLARQEMSKIVSEAEQRALPPVKRAVACPYCGKPIGYPRKKAGQTVICPYATCRRPIQLPSNGDGN